MLSGVAQEVSLQPIDRSIARQQFRWRSFAGGVTGVRRLVSQLSKGGRGFSGAAEPGVSAKHDGLTPSLRTNAFWNRRPEANVVEEHKDHGFVWCCLPGELAWVSGCRFQSRLISRSRLTSLPEGRSWSTYSSHSSAERHSVLVAPSDRWRVETGQTICHFSFVIVPSRYSVFWHPADPTGAFFT